MRSIRLSSKILYPLQQQKTTFIQRHLSSHCKSLFNPFQLKTSYCTRLALPLLAGIIGGVCIHNIQCEEETPREIMLFSGTSNRKLALDIASYLDISVGAASISQFNDGEWNIRIKESIRGKDIYIVQSLCNPVNDSLMELLLLIATFKRGSAKTITAVIPYYGYARQDRKLCSRVPISAADVAIMLETVGVNRVIAVDLHSGQIQGFFSPRVPVDNLLSGLVGATYFANKDLIKPMVISPDAGGIGNCIRFRDILIQKGHSTAELAMAVGRRPEDANGRLTDSEDIEEIHLVGEVRGSDCIIVDDIADTGRSVCTVVDELIKNGARRVFVFAVHGLFSERAVERISSTPISEFVVTDTVPLRTEVAALPNITQLPIAPLLAETIKSVNENKSVSALFSVLSYNNMFSKKKI